MMVMPRIFFLLLLGIHLKRISAGGCCGKLKRADESCLKASKYILASVNKDPEMSPCKDFFDYACGLRIQAWKNKANYDVDVHKELQHNRIDKMKPLLENTIKTKKEARSIKIVQKFFQGCRTYRFDSNKNSASLFADIQSFGGMPILSKKSQEHWENQCEEADMTTLLSRSHKLIGKGPLPFFQLKLNNAVKRNKKPLIMLVPKPKPTRIKQPGSKPEYDDFEDINEFMQLLADPVTFQQDGNVTVKESNTKSMVDLRSMVDQMEKLTKKLSNIILWSELEQQLDGFDKRKSMMTIKLGKLDKILEFIDLEQYFHDLSKGNAQLFNQSTDVTIPGLALKSVEELNRVLLSTSCEVKINYIWYKTIEELYENLEIFSSNDGDKEVVLDLNDDKKKLNGKEYYAKNGECLKTVQTSMSHASGALYVRNQKNAHQIKASVEQIANNIQAAMEDIISNTPVLDNKTKEVAHNKLRKILFNIGYPNMSLDNTLLDQYHETLIDNFNLTTDSYYDMVKAVNAWIVDREFQDLHLDLAKQTWTSTPSGDMADYNKETNTVNMPSGYFEHPLFWVETNDTDEVIRSMNYGTTGFTIGHEISHAFDSAGILYDGDGNYVDWELASLSKYFSKLALLEIQFNSITDPEHGIELNGKQTLDENMADNSGLRVAYFAYKKLKAERDKNRTTEVNNQLYGFPDMTEDQMFFVSYAQQWCTNIRKNDLKVIVDTDIHAPPRQRVNTVFKNSEDFSEAFNCPPGIGMNPPNKIQIW